VWNWEIKMAKKQKKAKLKTENSLPWATFIALGIGAIILSAVTWFGAQYYGTQMARHYVQNDSRNWAELALDNLNNQERSFEMSKLSRGDQYILSDLYKGTNMYRVLFLNAQGDIFWSSRPNELGSFDNWKLFEKDLKAGRTVTKFENVNHEKIVALTLKSHDMLVKSYIMKNHNSHTITKIAKPVFIDKEFVGSILMYRDITGIVVWMNYQAKQIAMFLASLIILIFAAIGALIWKYSVSRNKQNEQLRKAKAASDMAGQEAREMATQLQEMNADIADLNTELNANMKKLRETQDEVIRKGKMAQLGQLTATVAHDIRNPLGSIRTSTFLLRRKFSKDNPMMLKPLDRIEKGVSRCDGIITELLDFARTKDLNLKVQNFDDWLLNTVRETAEQLPESVSFECSLGLADKGINFDADSLTRAIVNFLTNASEAMVGKGNDLPANPTPNPTISVSSCITPRGVEISVSDNGPGISDENMKKILDPLFTTKSFGVGLGLPAVEKIFEKHQGGMEIISTEGQGATFTGWFPLKMKTIKTDKTTKAA